jgi:hypothetical protein
MSLKISLPNIDFTNKTLMKEMSSFHLKLKKNKVSRDIIFVNFELRNACNLSWFYFTDILISYLTHITESRPQFHKNCENWSLRENSNSVFNILVIVLVFYSLGNGYGSTGRLVLRHGQ